MACTEVSVKRNMIVLIKPLIVPVFNQKAFDSILNCAMLLSSPRRSLSGSIFLPFSLLSLRRSFQFSGLYISILDLCLVTCITTASQLA